MTEFRTERYRVVTLWDGQKRPAEDLIHRVEAKRFLALFVGEGRPFESSLDLRSHLFARFNKIQLDKLNWEEYNALVGYALVISKDPRGKIDPRYYPEATNIPVNRSQNLQISNEEQRMSSPSAESSVANESNPPRLLVPSTHAKQDIAELQNIHRPAQDNLQSGAKNSLGMASTNKASQELVPDGWTVVATLPIEPRPGELFQVNDLSLSSAARRFLSNSYPKGIYKHQKKAIENSLEGTNVCLTTGTASGKSLVFQVVAIEQIVKNPSARIMAIYPMKALGREQEERWEVALQQAGLSATIGRIDGSVYKSARTNILQESSIVVFTPDIIHAWLLSNLSNRDVLDFLKNVALIIVDEVHTYSGVFGSNSAFLFRRLQHVLDQLGASPKYVCASATIARPENHLQKLLGLKFTLVEKDLDSSPKQRVVVHLVNPPGKADFLTEVVDLLKNLTTHASSRFIAFVDSRKQVELISSILARSRNDQEQDDPQDKVKESEKPTAFLDRLNVLPYRAGYEEDDRSKIQQRLTEDKLKGVVSTSALELGMDIQHLDVCVLVGVPSSSTSLQQRIGRIGRHSNGTVIIINSGDVYDRAVFSDPQSLLSRPPAESALYLDNLYIQYIHALCLARTDGEHDQIATVRNQTNKVSFQSRVQWPENFWNLCLQERSGQIPEQLQNMKAEAGDSPNLTYPLRDIESQFKVEHKRGLEQQDPLGSLSFSQLMREAYPGAVYYYATQPYRVYRVNVKSKLVQVRSEKRYTTKPSRLPTSIRPNLTTGTVFAGYRQGDLAVIESNLSVRESINGIRERRGSTESSYDYPLDPTLGFYFDQPFFTRYYFTTGVVISHPVLNEPDVDCRLIAELLYETFLMLVPFERQDLNFATDKYVVSRSPLITEGSRFVALYDQTYGSLRLTNRMMEAGLLARTLRELRLLIDKQELKDVNPATIAAIDRVAEISLTKSWPVFFDAESKELVQRSGRFEQVIMPSGKGVIVSRGEEFLVTRIFLSLGDGLSYEGVTESQYGTSSKTFFPVSRITGIPGQHELGLYNYATGEVEPIATAVVIRETLPSVAITVLRSEEVTMLRKILTGYFDEDLLQILCRKIDIDYKFLSVGSKAQLINELIAECENRGIMQVLIDEAFSLFKQIYSKPSSKK